MALVRRATRATIELCASAMAGGWTRLAREAHGSWRCSRRCSSSTHRPASAAEALTAARCFRALPRWAWCRWRWGAPALGARGLAAAHGRSFAHNGLVCAGWSPTVFPPFSPLRVPLAGAVLVLVFHQFVELVDGLARFVPSACAASIRLKPSYQTVDDPSGALAHPATWSLSSMHPSQLSRRASTWGWIVVHARGNRIENSARSGRRVLGGVASSSLCDGQRCRRAEHACRPGRRQRSVRFALAIRRRHHRPATPRGSWVRGASNEGRASTTLVSRLVAVDNIVVVALRCLRGPTQGSVPVADVRVGRACRVLVVTLSPVGEPIERRLAMGHPARGSARRLGIPWPCGPCGHRYARLAAPVPGKGSPWHARGVPCRSAV